MIFQEYQIFFFAHIHKGCAHIFLLYVKEYPKFAHRNLIIMACSCQNVIS